VISVHILRIQFCFAPKLNHKILKSLNSFSDGHLDLGTGDSDSGVDGGGNSTGDGGRVPTPARSTDTSDAPQPTPLGTPANSSSTAEPGIEYIIVEPQGSAPSPASDTGAPATVTPTPIGSADLDFQTDQPAAIPGTTQPDSGEPDANEGDPSPSLESPERTAVEFGTPPQIPNDKPPTINQANAVVRSTTVWLGRAIMVLGPLFLSDPRVRAVWAAVNTVRWLAEYGPKIRSYLDKPKTLRALQDAVRDKRPGYEIHHIVEAQRWSEHPDRNGSRFPDRINSRENLVRIPYWKHIEISSRYSTPYSQLGGLTPREYLRGKSWKEQYEFGLEMLRDVGVLE
jgi:hypothetical protein